MDKHLMSKTRTSNLGLSELLSHVQKTFSFIIQKDIEELAFTNNKMMSIFFPLFFTNI